MLTVSRPQRCGLMTVLGGVLYLFVTSFVFTTGRLSFHWAMHTLHILPMLLLLGGLLALHTHQAEHSGRPERVGFYLSVVGIVLLVALDLLNLLSFLGGLQVTILYAEAVINRLGFLFWAAGSALFGIAALRTHRLPSWGAWFIVAGLWISLLGGYMLSTFTTINDTFSAISYVIECALLTPFSSGWILLGYGLWSEKSAGHGQMESTPG